MHMHKKGFFFTLDAIMALTILAVGMFLVLSMLLVVPEKTQTEIIAQDTMNVLSNLKIKNLNNPISGIGGELWEEGKITKGENTLLQQIGEFYSKNDLSSIERFLDSILQTSIPEGYFAQVIANEESVYPVVESQELLSSKSSTPLLIVKKELSYGISNTTTFDMWGPIEMRLLVWQR